MKKKRVSNQNKITALTGSVLLLVICAVILVLFSLEMMRADPNLYKMILYVLVDVSLLWTVNTLEMVYYLLDGYASVHRIGSWCRNALFFGLLYLYGCAFVKTVSRFYDAEVLSQAATVEGIMLVGVSIAVVLYFHNERYLAPRKTRIRRLKRRGILNDSRRFSMIVEKGSKDERSGITAWGRVVGEVHCGDRIILYKTGTVQRTGRVKMIITDEGKKVRRLHDAYCGIALNDAFKEKPDRLSILSDVRQYEERDHEISTENPMLRGYLYEYSQRYKDPVYFYHLMNALLKEKYLLPGFYPNGNKAEKDVMDRVESAEITFPSVNKKDHPGESILAVFTDWEALEKWREMMLSPSSAVMAVDFGQLLNVMRMGFKGIVINPFGPIPFFLNKDLIDRIVMTEEYHQIMKENDINR